MNKNTDLDPDYTILSIQVKLDGFSFYIKNELQDRIIDTYQYTQEDKATPESLLKKIKTVFEEKELSKVNYKHVDVVYSNELFTVVPSPLFDKNKLTDYLKFNTKILKTDFIVYDELTTQELVTIYIPYTNINNYFFDCFGTFSFYHSISILIKDCQENAVKQDAPLLVVNLNKTYFELVIFNKKRLLLANSFEYETPEDLVYFILFTAEQLELDPEYFIVHLLGDIDKNDARYKLLYKYIRTVDIKNK